MAPRPKINLAGTIWRPDKTTSFYYKFSSDKTTKTTSLYYKVNVGFVHRNWYETDTHKRARSVREKEDIHLWESECQTDGGRKLSKAKTDREKEDIHMWELT